MEKGKRHQAGPFDHTKSSRTGSRQILKHDFELLDLFPPDYDLIYKRLCGYLEIAEIVALSPNCKHLSHLHETLLPIEWNIDTPLSQFFHHATDLRFPVGMHNALILGSFGLQFSRG